MKQKNLWLCVGAPGSGKSTWSKKALTDNMFYVSRDEIRFSLLQDGEDYFAHEKEVFRTFVSTIQNKLNDESIETVIADATHLNTISRMKLLLRLDLTNVNVIPIVFDTSLETCLKRNAMREGVSRVSNAVVRRMFLMSTNPEDDCFDYAEIRHIKEVDE